MLSNMASSLILHKRIQTTVAKAKALRKYVEPLLTRAKTDSTHSRRVVFSYLQNKETVQTLFNEVADRIADRPGGYTRIIKTGSRLGDNAEMCFIELVDYNELMLKDAKPPCVLDLPIAVPLIKRPSSNSRKASLFDDVFICLRCMGV